MMRRFGPIVLVAFQASACSDARLLEGFAEGQTRIRLDPGEFVGFVPCLRGTPGALHTYVASFQRVEEDGQLVDAMDGGAEAVLTSGPVSCDRGLSFPSLATRFYAAEIQGFDRDITAAEVGTVEPRWSATCGRGTASPDAGLDPLRPTRSVRGSTVPMRGCTSFSDALPPRGLTQIVVDVQGALGDLRCGSGAGQVGFLEATLDGVGQAAVCGAPLVFTLSGVVGRYHTVSLTAFELSADAGVTTAPPLDAAPPVVEPTASDGGPDSGADAAAAAGSVPGVVGGIDAGLLQTDAGAPQALAGVPRWRTRCIGRSVPGLANTAVCDPLEPLP